jgi:arginyl-tRNA--protein-N-Asp/Glu arginylyltransferase
MRSFEMRKLKLPKQYLMEKWEKRGINRLNKELVWVIDEIERAEQKMDYFKRYKEFLESVIKDREELQKLYAMVIEEKKRFGHEEF